MKTHGVIYRLEHVASGRSYVGQTVNIQGRLKQHRKAESIIGRALRKYGLHMFRFEVLEMLPVELLDRAEADWIALYESVSPGGFNLCSGGGSGRQHSAESRAKMSAASKGKPKTEAHRRALAKSHIGRPVSPETRAKIGAANRGRVRPKP